MTRGQRKMHVLVWLVLGPAAVVGLVLAVMWRPAEPVQEGVLPGVTPEVNVLIDGPGSLRSDDVEGGSR